MAKRKRQTLPESKVCAFDIETTGLRPYHGDSMFAYAICDAEGNTEVFRLDQSAKERRVGMMRLRAFMADPMTVKVSHNMKFELSFMRRHRVPVHRDTVWHDTMIMAQMLRNDEVSFALDYLAWKYGGWKVPEDTIVKQQAKLRGDPGHPRFDRVDKEVMHSYQEADVQRCMALFSTFDGHLRKEKALWDDYLNELALAQVTQRIEQHGILLHSQNIKKMRRWLTEELDKVHGSILVHTGGRDINLNSGDQVAKLLFGKLFFVPSKFTAGGKPSVDKDVLLELRDRHPIINFILKNRSYVKGLGALKNYVTNADKDGRLHPNIKTNHAHTGREACDSPNLQNVEKEAGEKNPYPVPLRSVFRADRDHDLFFVDYSGIEMRLIIGATGEPELKSVLQQRGDVHHPTVQCFLGQDNADRLRDEDPKRYKVLRSAFKNTGFCVAYGGSDSKVAMTLGKPLEEILPGAGRYRNRFQRIDGFATFMIRQVKKFGYIETPFGRKLWVPKEQAHAGSNYLIQGTAAGVLKRAQVRVQQYLDKNRLSKQIALVLPIHDEIVLSIKRGWQPSALRNVIGEISWLMVNMPEINVPLDVEWKRTRTTWDKAKEYKL